MRTTEKADRKRKKKGKQGAGWKEGRRSCARILSCVLELAACVERERACMGVVWLERKVRLQILGIKYL